MSEDSGRVRRRGIWVGVEGCLMQRSVDSCLFVMVVMPQSGWYKAAPGEKNQKIPTLDEGAFPGQKDYMVPWRSCSTYSSPQMIEVPTFISKPDISNIFRKVCGLGKDFLSVGLRLCVVRERCGRRQCVLPGGWLRGLREIVGGGESVALLESPCLPRGQRHTLLRGPPAPFAALNGRLVQGVPHASLVPEIVASPQSMDLSLRDALGGGGGGAPAEPLLKRDFVASLEKESYDDKVGETVSKTDYRPLVDGKDTKSGQPISSIMKTKDLDRPGGKKLCGLKQGKFKQQQHLASKVSSAWVCFRHAGTDSLLLRHDDTLLLYMHVSVLLFQYVRAAQVREDLTALTGRALVCLFYDTLQRHVTAAPCAASVPAALRLTARVTKETTDAVFVLCVTVAMPPSATYCLLTSMSSDVPCARAQCGEGSGLMSSMMSSVGRQDPPGQPAFGSDYLSGPVMGGMTGQWSLNKTKDSSMPDSLLGFSQSGMGGTMGSGLPPFQTTMTSSLGHTGISPAMDTQKSSGLFGVENKTGTSISGSNAFKTSDPFSSGGPGIHSMDPSAAPVLSPSGSMDDSSPTSSNSEPPSPERVGTGGETGKLRRRKKKRKASDEVYDFLDEQENDRGRSDKHRMQEEEDDRDEEENWEREIRESGGGGRVKGRKSKSRARLPEEWGAPQQPVSPTPATVAPSFPLDTAPEQIPTSFTNCSHVSLVKDPSPRAYEPMCVVDYPLSNKDGPKPNEEKVSTSKPEANSSFTTNTATKSGDVGESLALLTGDNLSPVSQTFSFLDSVLQTPPGSTPDSQTTTPITNTPSVATASLTRSIPMETAMPAWQPPSASNPSKSAPDPALTPSTNPPPPAPATVASTLNVNAEPFIPSGTLMSSTAASAVSTATAALPGTPAPLTATSASPLCSSSAPFKNEATPSSSSDTPQKGVGMPLSSPNVSSSITRAASPSFLAHSEHQESSSTQLPLLEAVTGRGVGELLFLDSCPVFLISSVDQAAFQTLPFSSPSYLSIPLRVFALCVSSIHLTSSPLRLRLPVSLQYCNNHRIDELGLDLVGWG
ncbi:hypothetical protein CCH79_00005112 [Gambusia affinis]|uniref:Microtubule-associated protein 4 n=1 Tax=Gambusia affinis TaxID=33528 RepID=A0A315VQR7_GAMAF|nr:hypothetical protein CCH79_00005112 [Gambusia affinis]